MREGTKKGDINLGPTREDLKRRPSNPQGQGVPGKEEKTKRLSRSSEPEKSRSVFELRAVPHQMSIRYSDTGHQCTAVTEIYLCIKPGAFPTAYITFDVGQLECDRRDGMEKALEYLEIRFTPTDIYIPLWRLIPDENDFHFLEAIDAWKADKFPLESGEG